MYSGSGILNKFRKYSGITNKYTLVAQVTFSNIQRTVDLRRMKSPYKYHKTSRLDFKIRILSSLPKSITMPRSTGVSRPGAVAQVICDVRVKVKKNSKKSMQEVWF